MEHIQIASGPPLFFPEFSLRSRREQPVKDVFNARQYEYWQTDAPGPSQNFPDVGAQNPTMDMKPINTRTLTRDYRQSKPFEYNGKPTTENPYFQKFDIQRDPRNVARELQGAVYEYNPPRDMTISNRMVQRNFDNRYVPEAEVKITYEKAIDVLAAMRPKLNDMKAVFR
jgi:hypothetical protein